MPEAGRNQPEETRMKTIEISHTPTPLPPLTGAALRAAASADAAAHAVLARIQRAADRLVTVLNSETVDATTLAAGFEAADEFADARREIADLVPRHAQAIRINELQAWPINPGWTSSASGALSAAAESYRARLIGAGVPLPASGSGTAEFWRDAAARGC